MSQPAEKDLMEYLAMSKARAVIDQRMFELKRAMVLGLNPNEIFRKAVDGVMVEIVRNEARINITELSV